MTRTPDEVKKGLECCISDSCNDCPYVDEPMEHYCKLTRTKDSLALIQQLQDENAQQARCIENMTDKLNAMNDEVAELQAERDALMVFVKGQCCACKFSDYSYTEDPCDSCFADRRSRWQWRGVQEEG